jgi:hypothetical protein
MRMGLIVVSLATLFGFATPASAATFVTTGTSCVGSVCNSPATLQPFNSSLGTLNAIILQIDATDITAYAVIANIEPISTDVTTSTTFTALVNGVTYSLDVSGTRNISGFGLIFTDLTATGSATFVLDQSLFSSFIDTADHCGNFGQTGVCAFSGFTTLAPDSTPTNTFWRGTDAISQATYTLRYVYTPVPEPASWALMLLGFGAIGLSIGKKNARKRPSCPEELPATR